MTGFEGMDFRTKTVLELTIYTSRNLRSISVPVPFAGNPTPAHKTYIKMRMVRRPGRALAEPRLPFTRISDVLPVSAGMNSIRW